MVIARGERKSNFRIFFSGRFFAVVPPKRLLSRRRLSGRFLPEELRASKSVTRRELSLIGRF